MSARPWIVTDDPGPVAAREVGGKGCNLLRLRALGLSVPRFLIVGSRGFDETLGGAPWLRAALAEVEQAEPVALADASARIAERIRDAGCPPSLARLVLAALAGSGLDRGPLAVRSSAVGEDSGAHSFAGLLDSALNVRSDQVPAALVEVWASAFSPRCLAYRQRKGLGLGGITVAVVVQELVAPVASGVLFTRDPEQASRCLIVAAFGLGEGVVQSTVDADAYRIDRTRDGVAAAVLAKAERIVPSGAHGTRREPLPQALRESRVLTDAQVRMLRDLGRTLEAALGAPQDVEWAFDAEGRLLVLQARPIVAPPPPEERRVWDNSNIVESYPGLTLPLTFSFVQQAYAQAFRCAAAGFFPLANPVEPHVFQRLVGLLDGRVYYNLLEWYAMFSHLARPERHRRMWDQMVGIAGEAAPPPSPRPLWGRALAALSALRILLGVASIARRFDSAFTAFHGRHHDAADEPTPALLALRYRRIEREASAFWHLTLFNDLSAMRYHEALTALCRRCGHPDLANRLLAGEPGVESVAPVRSLVALAERVRSEPVARALFETQDDACVWAALGSDPGLASLRADFLAHLERFGDRGLEELKLETPTFREEPQRLVGLVRGYARAGLSVSALVERDRVARREAEQVAERCVRGPLRLVFGFVLARARAAIRNRENMRFARSRLYGIVRRLFRRLGGQLAAADLLDQAGDVFYLTIEETLGVVEGTAVTRDLKALVALRRREYAEFARHEPGPRIETAGMPHARPFADAPPAATGGCELRGTGCSAGVVSGAARVVLDPRTAAPSRDQVLVARSTDPGWVFLMLSSAGLVAERGSLLSHTAIIGRELGIPTVVGVPGATTLIPDGARLTIDGGTGDVRWA